LNVWQLIIIPLFVGVRLWLQFFLNKTIFGELVIENNINIPQAFFHRFCGFENNRISETLSLGEKSLSLANKILSFSWEKFGIPLEFKGKILEFRKFLELRLP